MDKNLMEVLMPLAIFGGLGTTVILFTKTFTDYILKKKMIEKGYVNDETQAIFKRQADESKFPALKWGLIIFFAGLALVIMEFVPTSPESPLPYGLLALFVSFGFLVYYFIVKKESEKNKLE